jgi:HEPN domain-containing protein
VAVAKKFPKVTGDIQEAGRCFASGRNTATVFHLMRVMEASVKFLGRRLKIDLVTRKNWGVILDQVDKAIKGLPVRVSRQRARRDRLAEASAHLRMVKDAWRNDVMHPKESYSEEEAERVFRNVKDFMVHVATKL